MFRFSAFLRGRGARQPTLSRDFFLGTSVSSVLSRFSIAAVPSHVTRKDATVLVLDCSRTASARLADVSLMKRIQSAVTVYEKDAELNAAFAKASAKHPFVILVTTCLSDEDCQMQQLVLLNALRMHTITRILPTPLVCVLGKEASKSFSAELSAIQKASEAPPAEEQSEHHRIAAATFAEETPLTKRLPVVAMGAAPHAIFPLPSPAATGAVAVERASGDDGTLLGYKDRELEKELWRSPKDGPTDLSVMQSLLDSSAYLALLKNVTLTADRTAATEVYVLVYRLGTASSVQRFWSSAMHAVGRYYESLTGSSAASDLIANYERELQAAQTQIILRGKSIRRRLRPPRMKKAKKMVMKAARSGSGVAAGVAPQRGVYLFLHANYLVGGDVLLLQREVQALYAALPSPLQRLFLGVHVVAPHRISEGNLLYVLQHTTTPVKQLSADGSRLSPQQQPSSNSVFPEVFRRLSTPQNTITAGATVGTSGWEASTLTPNLLVAQSVRVADVVTDLLRPSTSQTNRLLEEMLTELRKMQQGNKDEISLAAQRVEMKNMMTEAVEEVSVRHEQATSHLVKSLSSVVTPWATDELFDRMEAILKDQLESVQEGIHALVQSLDSRSTSLETQVRDIHSVIEKVLLHQEKTAAKASNSSNAAVATGTEGAVTVDRTTLESLLAKVQALADTVPATRDIDAIIHKHISVLPAAVVSKSTSDAVDGSSSQQEPATPLLQPQDLAGTEQRILAALHDIEALLTVIGAGSNGNNSASPCSALAATQQDVQKAVEEGISLRTPELLEKLEAGVKQALAVSSGRHTYSSTPPDVNREGGSTGDKIVTVGEDSEVIRRRRTGYVRRCRLRGKCSAATTGDGVAREENLSDLALQSVTQSNGHAMERHLQVCIRQEVQRALASRAGKD